ncbi:MAG TPA: preprotein translocase subunit SecG [Myxococcota bacterium]|nr:preprotein translocase subunit SecG [Myxococcota bacterium]
MLAFVIVLQVLVALFLIMVVLLQPGNRGGASAALGGAGSDTVFGARGANTFLSKITFGAAVAFMVTNFALSYMSSDRDRSVLDALKSSGSSGKAEPTKAEQGDVKVEEAPKSDEATTAPNQAEPVQDTAPANGEELLKDGTKEEPQH